MILATAITAIIIIVGCLTDNVSLAKGTDQPQFQPLVTSRFSRLRDTVAKAERER